MVGGEFLSDSGGSSEGSPPLALFQALLEASTDALLVVDAETERYCLANNAASVLTGYTREELLRIGPRHVSVEPGRDALDRATSELTARGKWEGRWRIRRKDGRRVLVDLSTTVVVIEGRTYYCGLLRDVTLVREEELRRQDKASQLAATLARVGAATNLEDALEALVRGGKGLFGGNSATARMYNPVTRRAVLAVTLERDGRLIVDRPPTPLRPGSYAHSMLHGGGSVLIEDFWALDPTTYPLYDEMRAAGLRSAINVPIDVGGTRIGSLHFDHPEPGFYTATDLAFAEALAAQAGAAVERARLEEERRASEARLRRVVDQLPAAVWITDAELRFISAHGAAFEAYAIPRDRYVGMSVAEFLGDHEKAGETVAAHRRALEGEATSYDIEWQGRIFAAHVEPLRDSAGEIAGCLGIALDVTSRAQLETERNERAKMDGAMLVVRTVAHELNNAIAPISGYAELLALRPSVAADSNATLYLHLIAEAAQETTAKIARLQRIVRLREDTRPLGPRLPVLDVERSLEA